MDNKVGQADAKTVRLVDTKTELINAKKARLVWAAAKIKKCGPLGIVDAGNLGRDLEWAAQWRALAEAPMSRREKERLSQINSVAAKLVSLLASDRNDNKNIERYWPDFSSPHDTRLGLIAIRKMVRKAQKQPKIAEKIRNEGGSVEHPYYGSPMTLFIVELSRIYKNFTKLIPAADHRKKPKHHFGGPFVRFVQEASRQFCENASVPSDETIKLAIYG